MIVSWGSEGVVKLHYGQSLFAHKIFVFENLFTCHVRNEVAKLVFIEESIGSR